MSAFDSVTCGKAALVAVDGFAVSGEDGAVGGNSLIAGGGMDAAGVGEVLAIVVTGDLGLECRRFCNRANNGRGSRRMSQGIAFQGMLLGKEDGVSLAIDTIDFFVTFLFI